jgi:D-lyxose ketol-isomerase
MRRSALDSAIDAARSACARFGYALPPFAAWTPADALDHPRELAAMARAGLGWAVAEFTPGRFESDGLVVFTVRMGDPSLLGSGSGKLYGEKVLVARDGQRTPHHFHVVKTEDIINRGGGRFVVELVGVDRQGHPTGQPVDVVKDVAVVRVPPGGRVVLEPGESIQLDPYVAHAFWAEGGTVLAGEVSLVNDDATDNHFIPSLPAPAPVEEDGTARYVTVRDLPSLLVRLPR